MPCMPDPAASLYFVYVFLQCADIFCHNQYSIDMYSCLLVCFLSLKVIGRKGKRTKNEKNA